MLATPSICRTSKSSLFLYPSVCVLLKVPCARQSRPPCRTSGVYLYPDGTGRQLLCEDCARAERVGCPTRLRPYGVTARLGGCGPGPHSQRFVGYRAGAACSG